MNSTVCTLFENHYHYGVAALTNSLFNNGFRGDIYAGYKGALPFWSSMAKENDALQWVGAKTLYLEEDLRIHFLPIETEYHLTNYKPDFMLRLWNGPAKDTDAIAYFDPDIVVKCRWDCFESWMTHGVALVHEVVSNDMPPTHPLRLDWEKVVLASSMQTRRQLYSYINGGFCGVSRLNREFLVVWLTIMNISIRLFGMDPIKFMPYDRSNIFHAGDQDALNIVAMCCQSSISEMGPEAMDFIPGGTTMSHAVGSPKPWKKNFILSALAGRSPSLADRGFWANANGQIKIYPQPRVKIKQFSILTAAFIGRFYRR